MTIKMKPLRRNETNSQKVDGLQSRARAKRERAVPAEINSGRNHSEHAGNMQMFRGEVGGETA